MKYGLVLGGGGVRGAYQVGAMKALKELKIQISAVTGVSIGAVNGALFVQGGVRKAEKLWERISINDVISLPDGTMKIVKEIYTEKGLDMSPFEKLLADIIDEKKIRLSPIDFGVATFSLSEKCENYYFKKNIPQGKLVEYLMASACFPGFKPKEVDNEKFIDGGVSNNLPINMFLEKGIDNIIVVDVKGVGFYRSFNLSGRNIINIKCRNPHVGTFEFNSDGIRKSIFDGYCDCMKAFANYYGEIYSFTARDYEKTRKKYSAELVSGIEKAAEMFEIDRYKLYKFDELAKEVVLAYNARKKKIGKTSENIIKKLQHTDEITVVMWLADMLENGKSDFLKEILSVVGEKYNIASAILYFKRKK